MDLSLVKSRIKLSGSNNTSTRKSCCCCRRCLFLFRKYSGCLPTSEDGRVQSVSNLSYLETFQTHFKTKNIVNSFPPIFSFWHTMCAIFYCFQICIKSCAKAPVSFTRLNETPIRHACLKTTTKRSKMTSERYNRSLY